MHAVTKLGPNKFLATKQQIKAIKSAIKRHKMTGITWQSVAARPATIDAFLVAVAKADSENNR